MLIAKYVRLNLRLAEYLFDSVAFKFNGNLFVKLMNYYCVVTGSKARFSYNMDLKEYSYKDTDDDTVLVFCHKRRAMVYRLGMRKRIDLLADEYLLDFVSFADGDTILDCGANIGELFQWFKNKNLKVSYIGFEPSPIEFAALEKNVFPSVAKNIGLWNEAGNLDFYVASQKADSSFIEPPSFDEVISVKTIRLDTIVKERTKFLKLEAEGAEPEILDGLGENLKYIEFISADLGFERGKESESTLVPVVNFLLKNNFSLLGISAARLTAIFKNDRY